MYGWRGRIGILIPSSDTTMEPEMNRMCPQGVSVYAARMNLSEFSTRGLELMANEVEEAAKRLIPVGIDALVFGCTSGSFIKGTAYDRKIIDTLEGIVGRPCTTVSTAVALALGSLGTKKVSIVTPYSHELNVLEKDFFESLGFEVTSINGFDFINTRFPLIRPESLGPIGYQDPSLTYRLVRQVATGLEEAIFISCTALRTIEVISSLERDLNIPVISSNQSAMCWALGILKVKEDLGEFGSLFDRVVEDQPDCGEKNL